MFLFGKRKQQQLEEERRRQEEERQRQEQQAAAREQRKQRLLSTPIIQDFIQKSIASGIAGLTDIERPSSKEFAERSLTVKIGTSACAFSVGGPVCSGRPVNLNFSQAHYPNISLSDAHLLIKPIAYAIANGIANNWRSPDRESKLKVCEERKMKYSDDYECVIIYRAKNAAFHQGWNSW